MPIPGSASLAAGARASAQLLRIDVGPAPGVASPAHDARIEARSFERALERVSGPAAELGAGRDAVENRPEPAAQPSSAPVGDRDASSARSPQRRTETTTDAPDTADRERITPQDEAGAEAIDDSVSEQVHDQADPQDATPDEADGDPADPEPASDAQAPSAEAPSDQDAASVEALEATAASEPPVEPNSPASTASLSAVSLASRAPGVRAAEALPAGQSRAGSSAPREGQGGATPRDSGSTSRARGAAGTSASRDPGVLDSRTAPVVGEGAPSEEGTQIIEVLPKGQEGVARAPSQLPSDAGALPESATEPGAEPRSTAGERSNTSTLRGEGPAGVPGAPVPDASAAQASRGFDAASAVERVASAGLGRSAVDGPVGQKVPIGTPGAARAALAPQSDPDGAQVASAVSRGLSATVHAKGGSLVLRLVPEALGQVRIQMQIEQGAVSVRIETGTAQAQGLLSEHLAALRGSLESKGLSVERLSVHHIPAWTAPNTGAGGAPSSDAGERSQGQTQHDASENPSRGWSGRGEDPSSWRDESARAGEPSLVEGAADDAGPRASSFAARLRLGLHAVA